MASLVGAFEPLPVATSESRWIDPVRLDHAHVQEATILDVIAYQLLLAVAEHDFGPRRRSGRLAALPLPSPSAGLALVAEWAPWVGPVTGRVTAPCDVPAAPARVSAAGGQPARIVL